MKNIAILSGLLFTLSTPVLAEDVQPYLSLDAGFHSGDVKVGSYSASDDTVTPALAVGMKFNENVSLELGYSDLGTFEESGDDPFFGPYKDEVDVMLKTLSLRMGGPANEKVEFWGRLGLARWDVDYSYTEYSPPDSDSESDSGTDLYFAFGAGFSISEKLTAELEYQIVDLEPKLYNVDWDVEVRSVLLGLRYGF